MTVEKAIAAARDAHARMGCTCPGDVIAVIRNDHYPGAEPSKDHYNGSIEHTDWCPLYQTMAVESRQERATDEAE